MVAMKKLLIFVMVAALLLGTIGSVSGEEDVEVVDYKVLLGFLPGDPSGWGGDDPYGQTLSFGEGTFSMASKSFVKSGTDGEITADVAITDYAANIMGWSGVWGGYFEWESTEGYAKRGTFQGFPSWEAFDKESDEYTMLVGINDRFLVMVSTNGDKDALDDFMSSIDLDGISTLGGGTTAVPTTSEEEETQSETTETASTTTTDETGTPGFESVFAIVGLLAVAYLIRRKD
ncbi:MAG: PGF-CTERM sorting domain-containing protein [Halobacteriota archaeon]|nr:PGF-CTERM sorting domain-containing protein [Halobacteriota archaeon]